MACTLLNGISLVLENLKFLFIKWLRFATKCPLWLNGWNDMGLTTH